MCSRFVSAHDFSPHPPSGPDACGWKWFLPYYHAPLCLDLYRYIASEHYKPEHSHSGVPSDLATLGDTLPFGSSAVALEYLTDVNCEIDGPVNPFTQLMSVLPADSATLVPECLRPLFYGGPTKHFYPTNFAIDTDGVKVPWGGVTLIPFIDPHLLESML